MEKNKRPYFLLFCREARVCTLFFGQHGRVWLNAYCGLFSLLSANTTSKTSNSTGPNIKKSIFFFYLKKFKTSFWIELSSKHLFFYMLIFLPPTLKPLDHFLIDENIISLTYYFVH